MSRWYWLLIAIALVGAWRSFAHRALEHPPGELAPGEPRQRAIERPYDFDSHGFGLTARARFSLTARVLAREHYSLDPMAELVPYDLALGWGLMSDSSVLDRIDVSQSNRFYYWHTADDSLPLVELARHSANMHLIAANSAVADAIAAVRVGQIVSLEGVLVDIARPDGGGMRTSLTREDTGAGACEIVWVERIGLR
jgi:hypothetical protein